MDDFRTIVIFARQTPGSLALSLCKPFIVTADPTAWVIIARKPNKEHPKGPGLVARTDTPSLTSHDAGHSPGFDTMAGWTQAASLSRASHWRLSLIFFLVWALKVIYAFLLFERLGDNSSNIECLLHSKCLWNENRSTARMIGSHTHTHTKRTHTHAEMCSAAHRQMRCRRIYKSIVAHAEPFRYYSPLITTKNALVKTNLCLFVFFSSLWSKWVNNITQHMWRDNTEHRATLNVPFHLGITLPDLYYRIPLKVKPHLMM